MAFYGFVAFRDVSYYLDKPLEQWEVTCICEKKQGIPQVSGLIRGRRE
jgi:hypothetical protein